MDLHPLSPWKPGWILARPVRGAHGQQLAPAGTPLSQELATRLTAAGLTGAPLIRSGSALPSEPEHIARYGHAAESELVAIFTPTLDAPLMANLLVAATAHARRRRDILAATR